MTYPPTPDPTRAYPPISAAPASPAYHYPTGPYPPQPHYGHQTVIVTQAPPASGTATAAMVFGILGILGGWCLFGLPCIIAVILGHVGLSQTRDGSRSGRGQAVAGLILGYVFVAPMILFTVMVFFGGVMDAVDPTPTPTP